MTLETIKRYQVFYEWYNLSTNQWESHMSWLDEGDAIPWRPVRNIHWQFGFEYVFGKL